MSAVPISAAPYPTNVCVAAKQREAGRYCKAALRAWSEWDETQNDGARDSTLSSASARLGQKWSRAEAHATSDGAECADTTATAAAVQAAIDGAVTDVVSAINGGLDLGSTADATCGSRLLKASATKCLKLLRAQGKHVRNLAADHDRSRLARALSAASRKFASAWASAIADGCPTTATQGAIESQVDGLNAAVVRDTTVSPNVDDTQFTTYSPTGRTRYLGRDFTPVCMNGTPYHFFAKRGSVNKVLFFLQGGGACWDQATCSFPTCDTSVNPAGGDNPNIGTKAGFLDFSNPANPFRDWNVVFVAYCSCDVHYGDAAQDYPLHVEHRGFHNVRMVEKWAREHFVDPEQVFITGTSAGAYGSMFNAPLMHDVYAASSIQVLADSGNGVVTAAFLQNDFPQWNFTANLPNIPGVQEAITSGTTETWIPGYTKAVATHFPQIRWAHYTTAYDGGTSGQTGFYRLMLSDDTPAAILTWWTASCSFNGQMRVQAQATAAAVPSNYRYYIGSGSRHGMVRNNKVYSDTTGNVPLLVDWVSAMLAGSAAWTNVECTTCGLTLPGDPVPDLVANPFNPPSQPFQRVGTDIVVNCGS